MTNYYCVEFFQEFKVSIYQPIYLGKIKMYCFHYVTVINAVATFAPDSARSSKT